MVALGILLATLAAFVISIVFYSVVAPGPSDASAPQERPRPWQLGVELLRGAVVSGLIAGLLLTADRSGPGPGALLGLALWALPVVLLTGAVLWEKAPPRSAVPHAGDWLIKLVAIGAVVGLFA